MVGKKRRRQYRKRKDSKSNDEEVVEKELSHLTSNLNADSDFTIDFHSDDSTNSDSRPKKVKEEKEEKVEGGLEVEVEVKKVEQQVKKERVEVKKVEKPKKENIDIWTCAKFPARLRAAYKNAIHEDQGQGNLFVV